jgi:hypothetical protein
MPKQHEMQTNANAAGNAMANAQAQAGQATKAPVAPPISLERREACRAFLVEFRNTKSEVDALLKASDGTEKDGIVSPHRPLTDAEYRAGCELLGAFAADVRVEEFLTKP